MKICLLILNAPKAGTRSDDRQANGFKNAISRCASEVEQLQGVISLNDGTFEIDVDGDFSRLTRLVEIARQEGVGGSVLFLDGKQELTPFLPA
jgi:hypothetical protein